MEHFSNWFRKNQKEAEPTTVEKFRTGIMEYALAGNFEQAGIDLLNANYPGMAHAFLQRINHSRTAEALQKTRGLNASAKIKAADLAKSKEESAFNALVRLHIQAGDVEKANQVANEKGLGGQTIQHVAWAVKLMNVAKTATPHPHK